jgi:hypothetical protein
MKGMLVRGAAGLACGSAALMIAQPAQAQIIGIVIGNMVAQGKRAQCMSGTPLPASEIAEARDPALAVMRAYWSSAASAASVDVTPAFHARGGADWRSGGIAHGRTQLKRISDPLAHAPGAALAAEPVTFVRSGEGGTARGLWRVSREGEPVGHYLADFSRRGSVWKLRRLELFSAGATPPPVTQYCSEPGDVEEAKAAEQEREARRAARRAEREAARSRRGSD